MAAWTPGGGFMTYHLAGETLTLDPVTFAPTGGVPPMSWGAYADLPKQGVALLGLLSAPGGIAVFDLDTGQVVAELSELVDRLAANGVDPTLAFVGQLAVSADRETVIASTLSGAAAVYRVDGWQFEGFLDLGALIANVTFGHDGATIAVQTSDGAIHRLDSESLESVADPLIGPAAWTGFITDHPIAFGPDDRTLVVGLPQGAQIWDLETETVIGGLFPNEALFAASPAFDGRHVMTVIGDHLLVWDLDTDGWFDIACRAAGRNMTLDEWRGYGPAGSDYTPTCTHWADPTA